MHTAGVVKEVRDGIAVVQVDSGGMCGSCGVGSGRCACGVSSSTVDADNRVGARPGDCVRLDVPASGILYAMTVLLVPLLLCVAGYWLGGLVGGTGSARWIGLAVGLGTAIACVALASRWFGNEPKCRPVVVEIAPERGDRPNREK
jgi:positive regulator of sigma E activity